jgi:hypothetical protein
MSTRGSSFLILALFAVFNCTQSFASGVFETGQEWLSWSNDARETYLSMYITAYSRGFRDGCETGQEIYSTRKPSSLLEERCVGKAHKFSRNLEDYSETISRYYQTYPEDQHVQVFKLIEGLADDRKLTMKQMHEYYSSMK